MLVQIVPEISGTIFPKNFRNDILEHSGIPQRSGIPDQISGLRKKIVPEFRISGTFSILEREKISGSFSYVNRNPEFWRKPYIISNLLLLFFVVRV